jgi:hypothetical protein
MALQQQMACRRLQWWGCKHSDLVVPPLAGIMLSCGGLLLPIAFQILWLLPCQSAAT